MIVATDKYVFEGGRLSFNWEDLAEIAVLEESQWLAVGVLGRAWIIRIAFYRLLCMLLSWGMILFGSKGCWSSFLVNHFCFMIGVGCLCFFICHFKTRFQLLFLTHGHCSDLQ